MVGTGGSGASISSSSGVMDNGSLIFNHADAVTLSRPITGTGSLTQTGSGILILANSNSYTGTTAINWRHPCGCRLDRQFQHPRQLGPRL